MAIDEALKAWDRVLMTRFPEERASLSAGLDDEAIAAFSSALTPYALSADVEALYRWANGGDRGVFGGWRMRPVNDVLSWRTFCLEEMQEPPVWLHIFDDQCLAFVELAQGMSRPSTPVWYGHTHDGSVEKLFASLEALVWSCIDAATAGALIPVHGSLRVSETSSLDGKDFEPFRNARNSEASRSDVPAGTSLSRFPDAAWPPSWLLSLGLRSDEIAPRGATHLIADLITRAQAANEPTSGTIRGIVQGIAGSAAGTLATVSDRSGSLDIWCESRVTVIRPALRQEIEFDVIVESGEMPMPYVPEPGDDPRLAQVAQRFLPDAPSAVATAVRPL